MLKTWKPAKGSNYKFIYIMLYIMENSCKWKVLPKKIKSIYPKNNIDLLMDRTYGDDKPIALAKAHGFHAVLPSKKNRKFPCFYYKQQYFTVYKVVDSTIKRIDD